LTFFVYIGILLRFINNILTKLGLAITNSIILILDLLFDIFLKPDYELSWLVLTSNDEEDKVSNRETPREYSQEMDENTEKAGPDSDKDSVQAYIDSIEALKSDMFDVDDAQSGDSKALENLKENHPSFFKDVTDKEALEDLKKHLEGIYDETMATNWSTSSEEYEHSGDEEELKFKRKREDDEDDYSKNRKLFKRDNDDDSNNRPGPSSGIGGFGPSSSSNGPSGDSPNNRVISDLMAMFLLFFSSIADYFSFFLSNLL